MTIGDNKRKMMFCQKDKSQYTRKFMFRRRYKIVTAIMIIKKTEM